MSRSFRHPTVLAAALDRLREPLYRNAFFLMFTSALGGLFGLTFWLIVTRYYTSDTVGLSASLIALAGFLGSLSTQGLRIGLIRFLPSMSAGKNHRINTSLTLAALTALGVGLVFLGGLDIWSPALTFIRNNWSYAIMFLAFVFCPTLSCPSSSLPFLGAASENPLATAI